MVYPIEIRNFETQVLTVTVDGEHAVISFQSDRVPVCVQTSVTTLRRFLAQAHDALSQAPKGAN
jgi:hypothetical protein